MAGADDSFFCVGDFHEVVYDQERGETVCSKCGFVVEEREIETEAVPVRKYVPVGRRVSACRTAASRLRGSNPRSIRGNLRKLLEKKYHPLRVQEKTVELFKLVQGGGIVSGHDASIVAKTLLFTSYRLSHVPVALSELAVSSKERKRILRCYKKICARLGSSVPKLAYRDYLSILAKKRKIDKEAEVLAIKVLSLVAENRLLGGANPAGVAATALYFASVLKGQRMTQKDVASAAGVSEVTVRMNLRVIRNHPKLRRCL